MATTNQEKKIEELRPVVLGKGCKMRFFIDHSKAEGDIHKRWTESSYDGQPDSEVLAVPPHWHRHHDEYMTVLEGEMEFSLEGQKIVLKLGDQPLHIPRLKVHGFTMFKGVKATFKEYTDPEGEFKEQFFRDVFKDGSPGMLGMFRACSDGDTYIALPLGIQAVDEVVTHTLGYVAKAVLPRWPART